jgi:hypothetical protein
LTEPSFGRSYGIGRVFGEITLGTLPILYHISRKTERIRRIIGTVKIVHKKPTQGMPDCKALDAGSSAALKHHAPAATETNYIRNRVAKKRKKRKIFSSEMS